MWTWTHSQVNMDSQSGEAGVLVGKQWLNIIVVITFFFYEVIVYSHQIRKYIKQLLSQTLAASVQHVLIKLQINQGASKYAQQFITNNSKQNKCKIQKVPNCNLYMT